MSRVILRNPRWFPSSSRIAVRRRDPRGRARRAGVRRRDPRRVQSRGRPDRVRRRCVTPGCIRTVLDRIRRSGRREGRATVITTPRTRDRRYEPPTPAPGRRRPEPRPPAVAPGRRARVFMLVYPAHAVYVGTVPTPSRGRPAADSPPCRGSSVREPSLTDGGNVPVRGVSSVPNAVSSGGTVDTAPPDRPPERWIGAPVRRHTVGRTVPRREHSR